MITVILVALALHIGFFTGYFLKEIRTKIKDLYTQVSLKRDRPVQDTSKSSIVDPLDPEYEAKKSFQDRMREINDDF